MNLASPLARSPRRTARSGQRIGPACPVRASLQATEVITVHVGSNVIEGTGPQDAQVSVVWTSTDGARTEQLSARVRSGLETDVFAGTFFALLQSAADSAGPTFAFADPGDRIAVDVGRRGWQPSSFSVHDGVWLDQADAEAFVARSAC